jgi:hypothetical protein
LFSELSVPPGLEWEGVFWEVNLPAGEPFDASGQFFLFAGITEPGTMTPISDIGIGDFTVQ